MSHKITESFESADPSKSPSKEGDFDLKNQAINDIRVGTDLVHIPRLKRPFERLGAAFFLKILTEAEWVYCQQGHAKHTLRRAAARIAAKEAVAKALGCGLNGLGWGQGIRWQDIEVVSTENAPPTLQLSRTALEKQELLSIQDWRLSISHDGDYAFASVWGLIR